MLLPPMPVLLSCLDLGKSYGVRPLFEGVCLGIDAGERVGLIGPNGSGKSTLMRILAGIEPPGEGTRAVNKGTRLVYLAQSDQFAAGISVTQALEAALETSSDHRHLEPYEREMKAEEVLTEVGFTDRDQQVSTLSGGWRKRLAIACALIREPDLLLMDEPTNHLDLEGILWLEQMLLAAPFTVLVVSHDRYFLERVATRVIEISKAYPGGHFSAAGSYSDFLIARADFLAGQSRQQEALDNRVRREIEWLKRGPKARTTKSQARIDQAGEMIGNLAELNYRNNQNKSVAIDFAGSGRRTNDLVVVAGASKALGGKPLFSDVDLTLSPGSKLGLLGLNGSGKSTFMRLIAGQLQPDSGTVKQARELKVVMFDQSRAKLDTKVSLRKALCPTGETVFYRGRPLHLMAWAKRFLFRSEQLDQEVGSLSGGEQARVLIANLMLVEADLLLLDEPTNDLDIPSLEVLEESLLEFPGALALVTHDRYLLDRVSTALLGLDGKGGAKIYADYAQWQQHAEREAKAREQAAQGRGAAAKSAAPAPAAVARAAPAAAAAKGFIRPLTGKERRELEGLEDKLAKAEEAVTMLQERIGTQKVVNSPSLMATACSDLALAQKEVERLYGRWTELSERAGA